MDDAHVCGDFVAHLHLARKRCSPELCLHHISRNKLFRIHGLPVTLPQHQGRFRLQPAKLSALVDWIV